tara:strand:- start:3268 stop:5022 length:1755 start_codon:yes stop_codon:yes gene_type:complete
MGAANSSNSTDLVTNVMSSISMDTSNNAAQAIINNQEINLNGCVIEAAGNVTMRQTADTVQQARQINKSIQNASIANDIAQKVAQEATSKVGSLGIGIADASNSVYAAVNASSDIKQALNNATSQYSNIGNTFNCTRSTIKAGKDLNITQSSTASTLTNQVLDGQQAAQINNKISQSVTQKASATVAGLAGVLIAIALIIAAFGYSIAKPLESGSFKIIIMVVMLVLLVVLVGFLYMFKAPPFFADSPRCQPSGVIDHALGCDESCLKPSSGVVNLKAPPLKYTLATIGDGNEDIGKDVNMARQIINVVKEKANNGGYVETKRKQIENDIKSLTKLLNAQSVKTTWQGNGDLIVPNPLAVYKNSQGEVVNFAVPSAYMMGTNPDIKTQGMCTPGAITSITDGSGCGGNPTQWNINSTCPPTGAISCTVLSIATSQDTGDDIVAVYNDTDFDAFKEAATPADWDVLRFCYVHLINANSGKAYIANNYGVADTDLVENSNNEIKHLKDAGDWAYKFTPSDGVTPASAGTASGGKLEGVFGFCDTQQYKINSFMQGTGKWIAIALLVAVFGYLGINAFRSFKPKEKE